MTPRVSPWLFRYGLVIDKNKIKMKMLSMLYITLSISIFSLLVTYIFI